MSKELKPEDFENELEYVEAELGLLIHEKHYELNEDGKILRLMIHGKGISKIDFIANLTLLTELYLDSNQIQDIQALSKLTKLTKLKFDFNQIQDIQVLSNLTSLTTLSLYKNQIQDIQAVSELTSLTELNLSQNKIQDVSALSKLTSLTELVLYSNQLSDISALSMLTSLTELDLSENKIQDIKALSKLTSLTELNLSSNQIQDIEALSSLALLTQLSLSNNQIQDIEALSSLTSLTELFLSNNQIKHIEALSSLTSLTTLYLSYNQIQDIEALSSLTLLTKLYLFYNPIENVPETILNSSAQEIVRWLQENEKRGSKVLLKDVKILLLGNTNIGKSNLLHLWKQRYDKKNNINSYPEQSDSTHGLVYEELKKDKNSPVLHIWDFGGQEYFHATHQLFFSPDALHVLLWAKKEHATREKNEEVFQLDYWFRCSEQLSKGDSDIEMVLIENYIDHEDDEENIEFYTHFPEEHFLEKFNIYSPHVKGKQSGKPPFMLNSCAVSLKYQKRLQGMFELLEERTEMLYQKNKYPKIYTDIRDKLSRSIRKIWTLSDYKEEFKEKDSTILKTLDSAGCLLYFHKELPEKIFTKPNLLLNLIYEHILNKKLRDKQGELTNEFKIAEEKNKLGLTVKDLETLLSAFKLIFKTQDDTWYAPQYLPETEPAWLQFFKVYMFKEANIIVSSDEYLMNSILLDIFQEYGNSIKKDGSYLFWQKGLVIEKEGQLLLVVYDRQKMRLLLYGDQQEKNQKLQKEVVDFIIRIIHKDDEPLYEVDPTPENLARTSFKNFIPKPRGWNSDKVNIGVSIDGNYYVNVHNLHEHIKNKIYTIKAVNYDDEMTFKVFSVFQFNQYLADKDKGTMKKVAISYSKDDLTLVNEFIKNLVPLQDDGLIASPIWYCTDLEGGAEWDKTIQENFEAADIIFFMVSPNSLATNYIKEYEIKTAIKKYKKQKEDNIPISERLRIIPIRLEYCSWVRKDASVNLGQFSALPYQAKPVTDYNNKNEAWYMITENIRMAIENEKNPDFTFKTSKEITKLQERQVEGKLDNNSKN